MEVKHVLSNKCHFVCKRRKLLHKINMVKAQQLKTFGMLLPSQSKFLPIEIKKLEINEKTLICSEVKRRKFIQKADRKDGISCDVKSWIERAWLPFLF